MLAVTPVTLFMSILLVICSSRYLSSPLCLCMAICAQRRYFNYKAEKFEVLDEQTFTPVSSVCLHGMVFRYLF